MRPFTEVPWFSFKEQWFTQIVNAIQKKGKEYILSVNEEEYAQYLYSEYELLSLTVHAEEEHIYPPNKVTESVEDNWGDRYKRDVYLFKIEYPFSGSEILFQVQPNPRQLTSYDIEINKSKKTVSFSFKLFNQDVAEFKRKKNECFIAAFVNIAAINKNIEEINTTLLSTIKGYLLVEKIKHQKENDFFAAINLKVNKTTADIFSVPIVQKKVIPQPNNDTKEFSSEPTMVKKVYEDILKVIYDSGKNMEKKPALYIGKDEEGLRDQFLFVLETRYESIAVTGETFNRSGKTDILLKYASDGSNVFVAECKVWHGVSEYSKAISQLFDRYLTWRDSKVAIIMFVNNTDFSSVLSIIKKETLNHPYAVKEVGSRGESSFSFLFHLPQDKSKMVYLEVMAFHYDKK